VAGASVENADFWVGDQSGAGGNIITGCIVIMWQGLPVTAEH